MTDSRHRVVTVTGSASGIGLAIALLLAKDSQERFKVYATMKSLADSEELEKNGSEVLGKTLFLEKLDVANEEDINRFVDKIFKREGRIDFLVNNAGIGRFGPLEDNSLEDIQSIFAVNCYGPILLTKKIIPHWKEHNYGHVVTISSVAGIACFPFTAIYNASKFAVEGFFESMALECTNFKGIKVSIIEPGLVHTQFGANNNFKRLEELYDKIDPVTSQTMKIMMQNVRAMIPNGKAQPAEDIAKVVLDAVTSKNPHLRYSTNSYFDEILKSKYADLDGDKGLKSAIDMYHG